MICINFVPSPVERNLIVSFFYCLSNFCCGSRGMPHTPSTHISFSQHTQAGYCYLHGINHYNLHPLLRFRPVFLKANVLKTSFQEQAGHSRKLVKPWRGTASPVWASLVTAGVALKQTLVPKPFSCSPEPRGERFAMPCTLWGALPPCRLKSNRSPPTHPGKSRSSLSPPFPCHLPLSKEQRLPFSIKHTFFFSHLKEQNFFPISQSSLLNSKQNCQKYFFFCIKVFGFSFYPLLKPCL